MTIQQNNTRNTVISFVITAHIIGFVYFLTHFMNIVWDQLTNDSYSFTLLYATDIVLYGLAGGIIAIVIRLFLPNWKYKLRYNFFAILNVSLGLFGWILCAFYPKQGGSWVMIPALLLGGSMLVDIYWLKSAGGEALLKKAR